MPARIGTPRLLVALLVAGILGCQAPLAPGTACTRTTECAAGLVCALRACRAECRASRDCAPAERCLIEPTTGISACSVEQVDDCTTHACPDGLVCHDNACVNACGTVVQCPDGVCAGDVCLTIPASDAGALDASIDAPQSDDAGVPTDANPSCHGPACDPVTSIAMGAGSILAVTASGALWGWGNARDGVLGDGLVAHGTCADCAPTPVRALAADGSPFHATHASVGADFSCAIDDAGAAWCWGRDYDHQRGDGLPDDASLTPHAVLRDGGAGNVPLDHLVAIVSGDGHTCALADDATAWCWGNATRGQLGNGSTAPAPVAVQATELGASIASVVASGSHTVALGTDGTIRGVGDDPCAQLAEATPSDVATTAVAGPVIDVASIATSIGNTCAVTRSGAISCWGSSTAAIGPPGGAVMFCAPCGGDCSPLPHAIVQPAHTITRLFGRSDGTFFGLAADGTLSVWGGAYDEPYTAVTMPVSVPVGTTVLEAHVSGPVACAVTSVGDVLCWGENDRGQLGRGTVWAPMLRDMAPTSVVWP